MLHTQAPAFFLALDLASRRPLCLSDVHQPAVGRGNGKLIRWARTAAHVKADAPTDQCPQTAGLLAPPLWWLLPALASP